MSTMPLWRNATVDAVMRPMPALASGVRLRHDAVRARWMLIGADRMLVLDDTAAAIVRRLDGQHSPSEVADDLMGEFIGPRETIQADVEALVDTLEGLGWVCCR